MFIALIIFLLFLGVVVYFIAKAPMDPIFIDIIRAVCVLVAILAVLDAIGLTHFGILTWVPVGR